MNRSAQRAAHVRRTVALGTALALLWWLLSGHAETLPLALGAGSVVFVVWFARRMDVLDHEGVPVQIGLRAPRYWGWLAVQICKANVDVARRVLGRAPITPTVVRVACDQRTDLGRVLYANSITLTPGTVSMHVTDRFIEVHSLTHEGAADLQGGEMCRRVTAAEGA